MPRPVVKDNWSPGDWMPEGFHNDRGQFSPAEEVVHDPHGPLRVSEEGLELLAEPVQARFVVRRLKHSVLGTLAMTHEKEAAFSADARQGVRIDPALVAGGGE